MSKARVEANLRPVADALLVSSSFLPGHGGIETFLGDLCSELSPRLAVLARAERDGLALPDHLGYPTIGFPGSMSWPTKRNRRAPADGRSRPHWIWAFR